MINSIGILVLIIVSVLIFSLFGCSGKAESDTKAAESDAITDRDPKALERQKTGRIYFI